MFCKRAEANPLARFAKRIRGRFSEGKIRQGARIFGAALAIMPTVNACTVLQRAFEEYYVYHTTRVVTQLDLERSNMVEPRPEPEREPFHFSQEFRDVALRHAWTGSCRRSAGNSKSAASRASSSPAKAPNGFGCGLVGFGYLPLTKRLGTVPGRILAARPNP